MMVRAAARPLIAASLAVLLLLASGICGCGDKGPPPAERLQSAAEAAREAGSAHAQLFVAVSPRAGEKGTGINVQGDVWADMDAGELETRLTVLGMELSLRYTDGKAFVRFGGEWYALEGEIAGGIDEETVGAMAGLLGVLPDIVASAREVEEAGERKVGGFDCVVLKVKPDLAAIASLPAVRSVALALGMSEDELAAYLRDAGAAMEVCVQKDEPVIREIFAVADVELPDMGEVAGIPLLPGKARLEITADFPAYGVEVDVQAPADAKPFRGLF